MHCQFDIATCERWLLAKRWLGRGYLGDTLWNRGLSTFDIAFAKSNRMKNKSSFLIPGKPLKIYNERSVKTFTNLNLSLKKIVRFFGWSPFCLWLAQFNLIQALILFCQRREEKDYDLPTTTTTTIWQVSRQHWPCRKFFGWFWFWCICFGQ